MPARPTLTTLDIAADPDAWRALGVPLDDAGRAVVGEIAVDVRAAGKGEPEGVRGWGWAGLDPGADLDGLRHHAADPPGPHGAAGPLAAVDHVVVATGDLDRTVTALDAAGLDRRRIRDAGAVRQAFYVVGPALVEVAGPAEPTGDPARLWGVTFVAADLDAAAAALGPLLGDVRDAVQPGRRIATVRREAGLGLAVALMTARRPPPP